MKRDNENSLRETNGLEQNNFKPLPPTEISPEAQEALVRWGVSNEQVDKLRQFTSQFRYDLCAQKIDRLSQTKAEFFKKEEQEFINFPSFFDSKNRFDGQCCDIGEQWIIQINESGFVRSLNLSRSDNNLIVACYYSGLSKTHFHNSMSNHIWNGLALIDYKSHILDEVYFDAAFQKIVSKSESGYLQKTANINPPGIVLNGNIDVPVGWINMNENSWNGNILGKLVLGASSDFQYIFSLGFVKDNKTTEIKPVIGRLDADGKTNCFVYNDSEQLLPLYETKLSSEQEIEIRELLNNAKKIKIERSEPTTRSTSWINQTIL